MLPATIPFAGTREITVPMPSVLADSAPDTATSTPRSHSPVEPDPDPAWVIAALRGGDRRPPPPEFPQPRARAAARCGRGAKGAGANIVECVMAPVREWLCGRGAEHSLCPGPPPAEGRRGVLAHGGGVYEGGGRRAERRGLSPLAGACDSGRGGARRCVGCATVWDTDFARCPICGSERSGDGDDCDNDGDGLGGGRPASVARVDARGSATTDRGPHSRPAPSRPCF
jgi:hypothetical protein